jgi:hypothetical protein
MILTFEEIKANAIRNSSNMVKEKIVFNEPRNYDKLNYISSVIGLIIATVLFTISIIF